jgi:hypothetical protein
VRVVGYTALPPGIKSAECLLGARLFRGPAKLFGCGRCRLLEPDNDADCHTASASSKKGLPKFLWNSNQHAHMRPGLGLVNLSLFHTIALTAVLNSHTVMHKPLK